MRRSDDDDTKASCVCVVVSDVGSHRLVVIWVIVAGDEYVAGMAGDPTRDDSLDSDIQRKTSNLVRAVSSYGRLSRNGSVETIRVVAGSVVAGSVDVASGLRNGSLGYGP